MNPCAPFRRLDALFITAAIALFFFGSAQATYAGWLQEQRTSQTQQQPSQPQQNPQPAPQLQDPSAPKPKKIWSNDDVVSLRTPADTYQAEKEAQEAADAEEAIKKAQLAKQIKEAGLTIKLPSTPEETQQSIKDKEGRIRDLQERLDRLNRVLPDALEPQKATTQKLIEEFTGDMQKDQLELKVLQDHLQSFAKTMPIEPAAPPPTVPPAPPTQEKP